MSVSNMAPLTFARHLAAGELGVKHMTAPYENVYSTESTLAIKHALPYFKN